MKTPILATIAVVAAGLLPTLASAEQLSGAGASFPAPLYQRWAAEYNKIKPDVQVNYQSVGSGAGVKQFIQEVVDFGASDAAMKDDEMAKVKRGVQLLPATAGSIVIAYNLPGVEGLKLSREDIIGIFLGQITKWNDPKIADANPGVKLPDMPITVAVRSDGSGTTFVFTKHLAAISPEFDKELGSAKTVPWPVGVGGKGNEGVTALIKQTPGTLGYVEYGYAKHNNLNMAALQNKSGNYIMPTEESATATLASVELPENFRIWPADPEGADDYPIATFTWLLLYKEYPNKEKLEALKGFVKYGLTDGQKFASELGYVPLPKEVVDKCLAALENIK